MNSLKFPACSLLCILLTSPGSSLFGQESPEQIKATAPVASIEATIPGDAKPVWTLAYKFSPQETLRYSNHQKIRLHATFEGGERIDVSELKQKRLFTVQSCDDAGRAQLAMQYEHVWMSKKIDDHPSVEFDSSMKVTDVPVVFRQVAHELKGHATTYYLFANGTSAFEQMLKSNTAKPAASSENAVEPAVSLVEGDDNQKPIQLTSAPKEPAAESKDAGTFLLPLPDRPVAVGDTWKHTTTVPVRLTAEINRNVQILRTFSLDAVEGDIATISFRSSIESPVKTPVVRGQLIQAIPRGTMQFDHVKGRMVRLQMLHNQSIFGAVSQNGILNCTGESTDELIDDKTVAAKNSTEVK